MRAIVLFLGVLLAGCATGDYHSETLERVISACNGEVDTVDHELSDYRKRLRFECRR